MLNKTRHPRLSWIRKTIKGFFLIAVSVFLFPAAIGYAQVTITADPGVLPEQVAVAEEAAGKVQDVIKTTYGVELNSDVEIKLISEANPDGEEIGGNSSAGRIRIWLDPPKDNYKLAFLISHEMVHQYQIEKVGKDTLNKNLWFAEGMADLIGVQAANDYDPGMAEAFVSTARKKGTRGNFCLAWIADRKAWQDAYQKKLAVYPKADLALLYLSSHYPPLLMWSYLYALRDSAADKALLTTYGLSIEKLDEILLSY